MKNGMTLEEIKDMIDSLLDKNPEFKTTKLEIKINDPSIAYSSGTTVSGIMQGFDWDNGRVFIMPEKELISKDILDAVYFTDKKKYTIEICKTYDLKDINKNIIGKIVSEPIIKNDTVILYYLYNKNETKASPMTSKKINKVNHIHRDFKEKEILTIETENCFYILKEV